MQKLIDEIKKTSGDLARRGWAESNSLAPIKVSNGTGLQITNCLSKGKSLFVLKEKEIN